MAYLKLSAVFLLVAPTVLALVATGLFYAYWLTTSDMSFIEFMQIRDNDAIGYLGLLFVFIGAWLGAIAGLNAVVYVNSKFMWLNAEQLKNQIGKDFQKYVFCPYS